MGDSRARISEVGYRAKVSEIGIRPRVPDVGNRARVLKLLEAQVSWRLAVEQGSQKQWLQSKGLSVCQQSKVLGCHKARVLNKTER